MIYWELCKSLKFEHTNKSIMHIPESFLEKEMHKVLCDFEKQTYHLILTRQLDQEIVNKKKENLPNSRLCHPGRSLSKIERKLREINT